MNEHATLVFKPLSGLLTASVSGSHIFFVVKVLPQAHTITKLSLEPLLICPANVYLSKLYVFSTVQHLHILLSSG